MFYDVNFVPTFRRIRDRHMMEQILTFLPNLPEVRQIGRQVLAYVDDHASSLASGPR